MEQFKKGKEMSCPSSPLSRIIRPRRNMTPNASSSTGKEQNLNTAAGQSTGTDTDIKTDVGGSGTSSNTNQEESSGTDIKTDVGGSSSNTNQERSSGGYVSFPQHHNLINTIPQTTGNIRAMAATSKGVLITASDKGVVRKWLKGYQCQQIVPSEGTVNAIVLQYSDHDGCISAFFAHDKGIISVWRINIAEEGLAAPFSPVRTLQTPSNLVPWRDPLAHAISSLCISDDGNFLYSGSVDHTLSTWSIQNFAYKLVDSFSYDKGAITALAVGPEVVISGSSDGFIRIWRRERYGRNEDRVRHQLVSIFAVQGTTGPTAVNALDSQRVDGENGWLYAGCSDGYVRCWKTSSLYETYTDEREPKLMEFHNRAVNSLACSGQFVFSCSADQTICLWERTDDGPKHSVTAEMESHSDAVNCIAVQDDWEHNVTRRILYSGSLDGTLNIWRVDDEPIMDDWPDYSPELLKLKLSRRKSFRY